MTMPIAAALAFVIVMAIFLLISATAGTGKSDRQARGGPLTVTAAGSIYIIVFAPILGESGLNLLGLLLLVVVVALPLLVSFRTTAMRDRLTGSTQIAFDAISAITALVLLAAVLVLTGGILSLLGDVSPLWATIAVGLCCGGYVMTRGRTSSIRTSRYAALFFVAAVLVFVVGVLLGSPGTLTAPLVAGGDIPVPTMIAAVIMCLALGFFDPNARSAFRAVAKTGRAAGWGIALAVLLLVLMGVGGILFFGGVLQAGTLPMWTVFAVLPPVVMLVVLILVLFFLASAVDNLISSATEAFTVDEAPLTQGRPLAVFVIVVGVALAVLIPNANVLLIVASVLAVSGLGALTPALTRSVSYKPGIAFAVGAIAGVVVAVVGPGDSFGSFAWTTVGALVAAYVIAVVIAAVRAVSQDSPAPASRENVSAA